MSRWLRFTKAWSIARPWKPCWRLFSTHSSIEHVRVPCASSGDITVSLHNIAKHDAATPLVIVIPPFSHSRSGYETPVPSCFQDHPTAVINYRWQPSEGPEGPEIPLYWPTPLHDINFGYSWLMENLGSGTDNSTEPRPAYVYGSYLGASLAAGLALTESHVPDRSRPMTIRGLIAHNGVYNWTTFLPDHPIHKVKTKPRSRRRRGLLPFAAIEDDNPFPLEEEGIFTTLKHLAPGLFATPGNLFDPFASACLFFHSANLHVPDDFTTPLSAYSALSDEFTAAVDALAGSSSSTSPNSRDSASEAGKEGEEEESADDLLTKAATLAKQLKPPRKGYLVFPPRHSTLRIPHCLFLHAPPREYSYSSSPASSTTSASPAAVSTRRKPSRTTAYTSKNNFRLQATELASLILRSLDMHELRPKRGSAAPWEWEGEQGALVHNSRGNGKGNGNDDIFGDGAVEDDAITRGDEEDMRRWEMERRVQSFEISSSGSPSSFGREEVNGVGMGLGLDEEGEGVVGEWLRERIDEDFGE